MCAFLSSSYFNSHPHEEDDGTTINRPVVSSYFNSHPHEEDDRPTMISCSCPTNFNSHPHEEDDDICLVCLLLYLYFNSHPHEEDDEVNGVKYDENIFQLTSSRRGWLNSTFTFVNTFLFQLTSSRRGWQCTYSGLYKYYYFNSHPHEEDDSNFKQK